MRARESADPLLVAQVHLCMRVLSALKPTICACVCMRLSTVSLGPRLLGFTAVARLCVCDFADCVVGRARLYTDLRKKNDRKND